MDWLENQYQNLRHEFKRLELDEQSIQSDPIRQFDVWLNDAICFGIEEPSAMVLSTISNGCPSSRVMLLKALDSKGFYFFTNYNSLKGQDLEKNPNASLLFFWPTLERQVRVEGKVEKVSDYISDEYFYSRPVESQLGAMVSNQSQVIHSRRELEEAYERVKHLFDQQQFKIERPPQWGGYCLIPTLIEFWQGRLSRLHDRIVYNMGTTGWKIVRKAP